MRRSDSISAPSFTLVEAMVALALASLLSVVTGRVAVLTLQSRRDAERVAQRMERGAFLLEQLRSDLGSLTADIPGHDTPVELSASRSELRLDALAMADRSGDSLHVACVPSEVPYVLVPVGDGRFRLDRSSLDLTDSYRRRQRVTVARDIRSLSWQAWNGRAWLSDYAPPGERPEAITMLRISIEFVDGTEWVRLLAVGEVR